MSDRKVCKNCHWYLMTTDCLNRHDMRQGLIGKCEYFMVYCRTEEEYRKAINQTEEDV